MIIGVFVLLVAFGIFMRCVPSFAKADAVKRHSGEKAPANLVYELRTKETILKGHLNHATTVGYALVEVETRKTIIVRREDVLSLVATDDYKKPIDWDESASVPNMSKTWRDLWNS